MLAPYSRAALGLLAFFLFTHSTAYAQPIDREQIPAALQPWVPWLLEARPERGCALVGETYACTWPGTLRLTVTGTGATFELDAVTDMRGPVALPGDATHWPEDVQVDGSEARVLPMPVTGGPAVFVGAGTHRIVGRFVWTRLPELIPVPREVARVFLSERGAAAALAARTENGAVWLARQEEASTENEAVELEVFRRIDDGVPVTITTRVRGRVAGRTRELDLGPVLVAGTEALSLTSDTPARLDATKRLRVQAVAGVFSVEIRARTVESPERLAPPEQQAPWPSQEIWVWAPSGELRQVELSGPPGIDPARTGLAEDWRGLAAYVVTTAQPMVLSVVRRGQATSAPNRLELTRDIWLDLDGDGYTGRDALRGTVDQSRRLDLTAGRLEHATIDGVDQLITRSEHGSGVELRKREFNLVADWRGAGRLSRFAAVGWSTDVQSLRTVVHLPPGWSVLAASGSDQANSPWLTNWDLYALFFVLVIALGIGRLTSWAWGAGTLMLLVLTYHQPGSPRATWVALLVCLALLRVIPVGRLRRVMHLVLWATAAAFAVIAIPYVVQEARGAIYPQLSWPGEGGYDAVGFGALGGGVADREMAVSQPSAPEGGASGEGQMGRLDSLLAESSRYADRGSDDGRRQTTSLYAQDPNATIQVGSGVSTWSWNQCVLAWTSPVAADQTARVWLLPPWGHRILAALRVLLLIAVALALLRAARRSGPKTKATTGPIATAAALGALALLAIPARAYAQSTYPPAELLQDLDQRLARAPACTPNCLSVALVDIRVTATQLLLTLTADAGTDTALGLPGPAASWVPSRVQLDKDETHALALRQDGFLHVRIPAGHHTISLEGSLGSADAVTLAFPEVPHRATLQVSGWEVLGMPADGTAPRSIELRRTVRRAATAGATEPEETTVIAPWFRLTRTIDIGVRWQAHTRVDRVSPIGTPAMLRVPLLPGEAVNSTEVTTENGVVQVSLGRDQTQAEWTSTLAAVPALRLTAAEQAAWSEVWQLRCSVIWQCAASGIAPTRQVVDGDWAPVFDPWPGESVAVQFARPLAAEGTLVVFDQVDLRVTPGMRSMEVQLTATVRTSRGGIHMLTLPDAARVQSVTVAGESRPVERQGNGLPISLAPGSQAIVVQWQEPQGIGFQTRTPNVRLGAAAANVNLSLAVPENRWLLWAGGPSWGPAVLFWSKLVLIVIAAWLLARTRLRPLKLWQWLVLGCGLTQIGIVAPLFIVGWFYALAFRKEAARGRPFVFDVKQLGLVVLTAIFLECLYTAVHEGLLVRPDMQVGGVRSTSHQLRWFVDRTADAVPRARFWSVSLWVWRILMLAWALWLAFSLIGWLRWGWRCFSTGGAWQRLRRRVRPLAAAAVSPAIAPASPDGGPGETGPTP